MPITTLTSLSQLNDILSKAGNKLLVIDFHATWCGPCHMIAPTFEALSKQYANVNFLKCDVDAVRDVAAHYRVQAMPTFVFIKNSSVVETIKGANKSALETAVRKHASSSSGGTFSGQGHTLGSGPSKPERPAAPTLPFWNNLDPSAKAFVVLLGAYALFWYCS